MFLLNMIFEIDFIHPYNCWFSLCVEGSNQFPISQKR